MSKIKNQKSILKKGFSIIEVVSAVFIFSIVTITFYGSFGAGLKSLARSKHRISATELANERMEIIRNMSYDSIGTVSGVPSGILPQNETITRSGQRFDIHTYISYFDDPTDGLGSEDENGVIADYKRAKIEVMWSGVDPGYGVKVVSKFVPNGAESDTGGGTLRFNAMDGSGVGISGTAVRIKNTDEDIDINTFTDSSGTVLLSAMPAMDRNYEITISKSGYESITTLPPYPVSPFDPTDVHASVVENDLSSKAIIIDKLSSIHVFARDIFDDDHLLPNLEFNLKGGRVKGLLFGTTTEVTSYEENISTGGTGEVSIADLSPGKYQITLNDPDFTVVGSDVDLPVALAPDQDINVNLIVANNTVSSLVLIVKNFQTGLPISNATVRLSNGLLFDVTLITGETGRIYFPPSTDPPTTLDAGIYSLEVTVDGYSSYTENIPINLLTQKEISLEPIIP